MGTEKLVIKDIEILPTLRHFSERLAELAPDTEGDLDPVQYFKPRIDLMDRFSLGTYQWCIVDFSTQRLLAVGGMIEQITGKPARYWLGATPETYLTELSLPDEIPYWMGYVQFIYKYILQNPWHQKERSLHPHIYTTIRRSDGELISAVTQFIDWIVVDGGGVPYCLCQTTDISHLRPFGPPQMCILEAHDGENRLLVSEAPSFVPNKEILLPSFTLREKQVLRLLVAGCSSKMIAVELGIARNTVENHRQRLLKKSGCSTSSKLAGYAVANGLI